MPNSCFYCVSKVEHVADSSVSPSEVTQWFRRGISSSGDEFILAGDTETNSGQPEDVTNAELLPTLNVVSDNIGLPIYMYP